MLQRKDFKYKDTEKLKVKWLKSLGHEDSDQNETGMVILILK